MATPSTKKTVTTHPATGSSKKIDEKTYQVFSKAILDALRKTPGMSFTDLSKEVATRVKKSFPGFKGSASWYTITVRLDLENKGLVENYIASGKKFSRLKK
jgi:hypothetical protein